MPLPELLEFHGDWERYEEELYQVYLREIVHGGLMFRGLPIRCQYRPPTGGKHFGFWHVISTGHKEEERVPDLRRCERLRWIPWVIREAERNPERNPDISWWEVPRGRSVHTVLWLEPADFVVVLAKRTGYYLLKTAYCVEHPHRRRSLQRERDAFHRAQNG